MTGGGPPTAARRRHRRRRGRRIGRSCSHATRRRPRCLRRRSPPATRTRRARAMTPLPRGWCGRSVRATARRAVPAEPGETDSRQPGREAATAGAWRKHAVAVELVDVDGVHAGSSVGRLGRPHGAFRRFASMVRPGFRPVSARLTARAAGPMIAPCGWGSWARSRSTGSPAPAALEDGPDGAGRAAPDAGDARGARRRGVARRPTAVVEQAGADLRLGPAQGARRPSRRDR